MRASPSAAVHGLSAHRITAGLGSWDRQRQAVHRHWWIALSLTHAVRARTTLL